MKSGLGSLNQLNDMKSSDLFDIDTGLEKWQGQEVSTQSDPLVDPGTGEPFFIRSFTFHFDPKILKGIKDKKIPAPTKQKLFNSNWSQIRTMLWGDGLIAIQEKDFEPRMKIGKKKYTIVLLCKPRTKVSGIKEMLVDKPKNLNEYLHGA